MLCTHSAVKNAEGNFIDDKTTGNKTLREEAGEQITIPDPGITKDQLQYYSKDCKTLERMLARWKMRTADAQSMPKECGAQPNLSVEQLPMPRDVYTRRQKAEASRLESRDGSVLCGERPRAVSFQWR
jgi:hypothetical protein